MIREIVKGHYLSHLGDPSKEFPFNIERYRIDILKWNADANPEEVALYATLGSSEHPLKERDAGHRMEFFLGLLPEKDEVVESLAILAAHPHMTETHLDHGHTLKLADPLWPGTRMRAYLVMHPAEEIIPVLAIPGGPHVEFLMAIPMYDSEFAFKREHGPEELLAMWDEKGVRFYDPHRDPEPPLIRRKAESQGRSRVMET